jgi:hypothetical protein
VHGVAGRVTVCGHGSVAGCHGWIGQHPEDAYATGWLIPRNGSLLPADVPLVNLSGLSFLLLNDGTVKDLGRV